MKQINILLLLTISILAYSCSKDNQENIDLATSLEQTSWKGTYIESEGQTEIKADIGLAFYTEKEGYCDLKFNNQ